MCKKIDFDVVVVGAGVAGLYIAKGLSAIGIKTLLLNDKDLVAGGASTRNEGWLHRGTYHSTSIQDRRLAIQVARRCIYGHEEIKKYAPEAVEEIGVPTFAVIKDTDRIPDVLSRWEEARVSYRDCDKATLTKVAPEVTLDMVGAVFEVDDVSINTRILYRKLLMDCIRYNVTVLTGAQIHFEKENVAMVELGNGEMMELVSDMFVYATGYGTKDLFNQQFGIDIQMRYWKSHLIIFPRLTYPSVFCIDPYEAAMINHGEYSIVGLNEDAVQCSTPSFNPVRKNVIDSISACKRLFEIDKNIDYQPVACTKVDIVEKSDFARSLNISISEPMPNHICVLPGKMTETPYIANVTIQLIYSRINDGKIATRPMDTWNKYSQKESELQ